LASNGSGSYTYNWSPLPNTTSTVTGLLPGNYPVTVTDNVTGCTASTVVAVPAGPGVLTPVVSNITPVSCNGATDGTATISVSGGVGPTYFFNWSPAGGTGPTSTPLAAGTYSVTIFDAGNPGCPAAALVTITQPNPLQSMVLSVDSANCPTANGQATVNAFGGVGPYTYNWGFATGATQTGLAAGTYNVTATDQNGCTSVVPVTVDCILPVELLYLAANPVNGDISVDWESSNEINNMRYDVQRSEDGQVFAKIGEVAPATGQGGGAVYNFLDRNVRPDQIYFYRLEQWDFDGSNHHSNVVQAMVPSVAETAIKAVFPNPFEDQVNIELKMDRDAELKIVITNVAGQDLGVARSFNLRAGKQVVNMNLKELAAGMYFAKLYVNGQQTGTSKIVKAK
jgi:hypothetical protein